MDIIHREKKKKTYQQTIKHTEECTTGERNIYRGERRERKREREETEEITPGSGNLALVVVFL